MKIAIVAPSPVPYTIGGAENLFWGLQEAINQEGLHQAELIKLPSRERTFIELIDTYEAFSKLDLSYFDAIISTKYPAWMVRHDHHICYMQHRLRGLYDTYALTGLSKEPLRSSSEIGALLMAMDRNAGNREALDEVFGLIRAVIHHSQRDQKESLAFPGPLIRKIVHFLDGVGLSSTYIHKYAAISQNVARRRNYFPPGVPVSVVHHPSNLKRFENTGWEDLFTVGRLDGPKRIGLLIEAMKYVKSPVQLKIAGAGPDEEKLKTLAEPDNRIRFLGFINDTEVIAHYANALVVPFFPYDEDYGLVTIEAMMSGKPVLTTWDSGGPNEFVEDYQTGFSVPPEPRAIAEKIDYFFNNRSGAIEMGREAEKRVQPITWNRVIRTLLDEKGSRSVLRKGSQFRKKLTVALTFPVYPPQGGGQSRVFHLYSRLAKEWDIDLVTFAPHGHPALNQEIAPGLREIRVPKTLKHQEAEGRMAKTMDGLPVEDVLMPKLYGLTPDYGEALAASALSADILVASHPYLVDALQTAASLPLWYEAQDVESHLKKQVLPDSDAGKIILASVFEVEKRCCDQAQVIMACSDSDGKTLQEMYGADPLKIVSVPNGVDSETVRFHSGSARRRTKARMNLGRAFTACFMGSWHPPNLDAVHTIIGFAPQCPDVVFFVFGSVCKALTGFSLPCNVKMLGLLDEEEKQVILEASDLALNPMTYGSGTNLKMLDYFAAGIPVLSTPFGGRGLGLVPGETVLMSERDQFGKAVRDFFAMDRERRNQLAVNARKLVEARFDWDTIAQNFRRWLTQDRNHSF